MLRVPPISSRFKEAPILRVPENEREPFWKILVSASPVCFCASSIPARSVEGSRAWQSSLPGAEVAHSASIWIILWYSNVFNTFSFIRFILFIALNRNFE
jgi:hypothetical protein